MFSVTKDDCDWEVYRGSGPGGQHRNKTATAVRCTHRASGATGQATEDRSQLVNRQKAFHRMAVTPVFRAWADQQRRIAAGMRNIDDVVADWLTPENLDIQVRRNGEWRPE